VTEQDALLEAVFAAPADDTPRLVYADWLDEHGEPEYAAFIRAQVELARHARGAAGRAPAKEAEQKAWRRLRRKWSDLAPTPEFVKANFSRGFPRGAAEGMWSATVDDFAGRSHLWWPRHPIRRLSVYTPHYYDAGRSPDAIFDSPHLPRLAWFEVDEFRSREYPLSEAFAVRLFSCDRFERLVALEVGPVPLSRRVVDAVLRAPFLPRLRRLHLRYCCLEGSHAIFYPSLEMINTPGGMGEAGGAPEFVARELHQLRDELLVVPPGAVIYQTMLDHTQNGGTA
jgi:uncharacterized protein (TIGR02996 family)